MMKIDRLNAITDGVIAIAATIMVLELAVPEKDTFLDVFEQWPIFLAHFNSFFLIYIVWYAHSKEFEMVKQVNSKIVLVNGIWLATLSLIPFFTYWVGINPNSVVPQFLYTLVFLLTSVLFQVLFMMIAKEYPEMTNYNKKAFHERLPIYAGLIIALIISFIKPIITLIIIFVVILFMLYLMLKND